MYAGESDGLACRRLACMGPDDGVIALIVMVMVVNRDTSDWERCSLCR